MFLRHDLSSGERRQAKQSPKTSLRDHHVTCETARPEKERNPSRSADSALSSCVTRSRFPTRGANARWFSGSFGAKLSPLAFDDNVARTGAASLVPRHKRMPRSAAAARTRCLTQRGGAENKRREESGEDGVLHCGKKSAYLLRLGRR